MKNLIPAIKKFFSLKPRSKSNVTEIEIRELARSIYPNDNDTQNYIFKQQLAAYKFMQIVEDFEVKKIVIKQYPRNYSMQQYIYNEQLSAKNYMNIATNETAKEEAIRKYPHDYSVQKYIYDNIIENESKLQH
jgi:hypothetical protein